MQSNEISIRAKDGTIISAITNSVEDKSIRGIVLVCHGFGEHSGSYQELTDYLMRANYASVVFDQRGHGRMSGHSASDRKKLIGMIPSYNSFLDDMEAVVTAIKEKAPNTSIALYGHSMGGNIAANYLLRHNQSDFLCAILESPWLGLYEKGAPPPARFIKGLSHLIPNMPLPKKLTQLPLSDITSDEIKQKEMGDDPLYHNRMTLRMFSDICDGCAYALDNASRLSIPTLLAYAREEKIVSNKAIHQLRKACGANVTIKGYESHHSIHNDKNRIAFYHDLIDFLNVYCPAV